MGLDLQKGLRGFTLLELIIVVAIIGILASIVMFIVSDSKETGSDGNIKQNLTNARSQAAFYFNGAPTSTNSYLGVCNDARNGIVKQLISAARAGGVTYVSGNNENITASQVVCHDTALGWAAASPLKSTTGAWCIDHTSFSGEVLLTALDTNGDVTCQ